MLIYLTLNVMHINAEIRSDRRIKVIKKKIEKYRNNEIITFSSFVYYFLSFVFLEASDFFSYLLVNYIFLDEFIRRIADRDRNLSHFSPLSILHSLLSSIIIILIINYNLEKWRRNVPFCFPLLLTNF